jgi:Conserved hypothetical protein (Lin0512_fam)
MAWIRCVTEMGMRVDVHGLDYTRAAKRAVFDAFASQQLGISAASRQGRRRYAGGCNHRRAQTRGRQAMLETLPHGTGHINVVHGGLQVLNEKGDDGWLIANAIIVVSMDDGK